MTQKKSFFIRDTDASEKQKVAIRQELLCSVTSTKKEELEDFFAIGLPVDIAGQKNCENLVGSVEIPVGVAGPVTAKVAYVSHEGAILEKKSQTFLIPLATTEGALVASIYRGLKILDLGKTTVIVQKVGMSRSVVFECQSIEDAITFSKYFSQNYAVFAKFCEETSSHLQFLSHEIFMRDKLLYIRFVFDTDEAMGMNMVTIALSHAWDKFKRQLPDHIWVSLLTVSGNVCTDKKDSMINRLRGRGYFVTVETRLAAQEVERLLKVKTKELVKTHLVKNVIGSNVAGSFAQNMHVANALGAFYLATGQDVAHLVAGSEASVHFELLENNELYVALTLPNVSVGTVGGGTWLPKQTQARSIILEKNTDTVVKAHTVAAATGLAALAGEISGLAALATNTLASAHAKLGRSKKR